MRGDRDSGERRNLRGSAANDNGGPEARVEAAVLTIARLLGRQIAREMFERASAANDDTPPARAGEDQEA